MTGLVCQSVDKIDNVAEWVKARYGYIFPEIEAAERTKLLAAPIPKISPSTACGGRRQEPMTPHQEDEEEAARYRNLHKYGRGPQTEVCWKRRVGGGRRGRVTLRTMAAESTLDAA